MATDVVVRFCPMGIGRGLLSVSSKTTEGGAGQPAACYRGQRRRLSVSVAVSIA